MFGGEPSVVAQLGRVRTSMERSMSSNGLLVTVGLFDDSVGVTDQINDYKDNVSYLFAECGLRTKRETK